MSIGAELWAERTQSVHLGKEREKKKEGTVRNVSLLPLKCLTTNVTRVEKNALKCQIDKRGECFPHVLVVRHIKAR